MALLDFKEIPLANGGGGLQDEFELFARDFFDTLGFQIEEDPDRGADGGRDIIIIEKRTGTLGDTIVRWLVSCKHKAHSGESVLEKDEEDIAGRVEQFHCDGFIGFYSTISSSGLSKKINSLKDRYEICIFDHEKIEKALLENTEFESLIKRYFPVSYKKQVFKVGPSMIYGKYYPLKCEVCGKDLIKKGIADNYGGLVALVQDMDYFDETNGGERITQVYCACKGQCDSIMESRCTGSIITQWQDISDLTIPYQFLNWVMGILNQIRDERVIYTDEAFEQIKTITLDIAQVVMRQPSVKEMQRVKSLLELPDWV
jgi:hypothetical protein